MGLSMGLEQDYLSGLASLNSVSAAQHAHNGHPPLSTLHSHLLAGHHQQQQHAMHHQHYDLQSVHAGIPIHRLMEQAHSHPIATHDLAMSMQEMEHMTTAFDPTLVEGVITALEGGELDTSEPPKRKKMKGPPQEAVHRDWNEWYNDLLEYGAINGHCNIPSTCVLSGGRKLGWWLTNQRRNKKHGKLRQDRSVYSSCK
jgi:hypothetical protein